MIKLRRTSAAFAIMAAAAALATTACDKKADNTANYKAAINTYLAQSPVCLYRTPQQFPQKVDASDNANNAPLAALYDQHLLNRTADNERVLLIVHKTVNIYDLSDAGRGMWTPDASQPGFGNFCYGKRDVSSIDSATPNDGKPGDKSTVAYHYTVDNVPAWAKTTEVQAAFPGVAAALNGGQATATLVDTNNGWAVQP